MIKFDRVKIAGQLEKTNYILLLLSIIIIPLTLDGKIYNPYFFPKWLVALSMVSLMLLLTFARWILIKQITIRRTFIDKAILILCGAFLFSAIFSALPKNSFFGRSEFFILNISALVIFALYFLVIIHYLDSHLRFRQALNVLGVTSLISNLLFLGNHFFHISIVGGASAVWNTIASNSSNYGLFLAVVFLISAGLSIKKDVARSELVLFVFSMLSALLSLTVINDRTSLGLLLFGVLAILLICSSSFQAIDQRIFFGLAAVFVIVLLMLGMKSRIFAFSVVDETRLNYLPSASVVFQTVGSGIKESLLGTGPGTFSVDFAKFRDPVFNYNEAASSLIFNYPFGTLFAIFAETGFIGIIALGYLFFFVTVKIFAKWKELIKKTPIDTSLLGDQKTEKLVERELQGMDVLFLCLAWVVLTFGMIFVYFDLVIWFSWWLILGFVVSGFHLLNTNTQKNRIISLEGSFKKNLGILSGYLTAAFILIFFILLNARWYTADKLFTSALAANDFSSAESYIKKAINYHDLENYHLALSGLYLKEAENRSKAPNPDLKGISTLLGNSVNESRRATEIAPLSVNAWESLATVYEKASGLAPEARGWAARALKSAFDLEPTSATFAARIASNYEAADNWSEAVSYYQQAVELKKDYTGAYLALANAYERNNEINKAIEIFSTIFQRAPDNYEALYNYGRLLYNRNSPGDRDAAEKLWQKVLEKQPNYSNALYSLGLLNELRGNRKIALSFYYKVRDLNPGNTAVINKIKRLGGK